MIKTEVHFYELQGEHTVGAAAQLLDKLPNGWTLRSLTYERGAWTAKVTGPATVMD